MPAQDRGDEDMLTFKEAMKMLKVSRTTMYRFIEAKKLTRIPASRALDKPRVLFNRSEVLALLQKGGE